MSSTALSPSPSRAFTKREGRKFAFPVGTAFGLLAAFVLWREKETLAIAFGALASGLFVLGAVIPAKLGPLYRAWMSFALAVSKVTTPLFLGVMWLLVITPFAIAGRLFGHKPLTHRELEGSYWQARPESRRKSDMKRQF